MKFSGLTKVQVHTFNLFVEEKNKIVEFYQQNLANSSTFTMVIELKKFFAQNDV